MRAYERWPVAGSAASMRPSTVMVNAPPSATDEAARGDSLLHLVAEQLVANDELRAHSRGMPGPGVVSIDKIRRGRARTVQLSPHAHTVDPGSWAGPVSLRVHPLPAPDAIYLHVHGGGFVMGSSTQHDVAIADLGRAANVEVISVDYRLAPEFPFPVGRNDVGAAVSFALDEARSRGLAGVIVGAESAGANHALGAVVELGIENLVGRGLLGLSLSFGFFDLGLSDGARKWGEEYLVLNTPWLDWFATQYLPGVSPSARSDALYSPAYADLHGLPPTQLIVGTLDPLLDDSLLLHESLCRSGVDVTFQSFPEAPHGFLSMPTKMGRAGMSMIGDWIKERTKAQPVRNTMTRRVER